MLRPLHPTDRIQLVRDPNTSTFTVPVQVSGPFSIVLMSSIGAVTVQVNNRNMFNVRQDYGIAQSPTSMHSPSPTLNPSFSAYWANTSLSAGNSASNQYIDAQYASRHIRLSGAGLTSTSAVYGYVFAQPRV